MVKAHVEYPTKADIANYLCDFEQQYGMSSSDFYEKYSRGAMGDAADVIEWAALYEWSLKPSRMRSKVKA